MSLTLCAVIGVILAINMVKGGEPGYLLAISEFIAIAAGAVWLFWMAARGEIRFRSSMVSLPALLFAGALFISSLLSLNSASSFKGLHEMISYMVIFFICLNLPSGTDRRRIAYLLLGVAGIQAAVAIGQAVTGTERVSGTLVYATYLVDILIIGLSLACTLILFSKKRNLVELIISGVLVALVFVALFLTRARAGLPVLAASLFVIGALKNRRVLVILTLVVLAAAVIPNPVRDRIIHAGTRDVYAMKRPSIWKQAVEITRVRPSAGVGMRNYVFYSRMTNFPVEGTVGRYGKVAKIAHNQYLHYAAVTGLAGVGTFLLFVGAVLAAGVRHARSRDPVAVGSLAAFTALLVHCIVDNALYLPLNGYAFFALGGLLCSSSLKERIFRSPPRGRVYITLLALAYGLMVGRPALSYHFYNSGLKKAANDDIGGAIRSCRRALSVSPREAVYHNALAKLYARRYDETGGMGYLYISQKRHESAVRSNPLDRVYWENFADFKYDHRMSIGEEDACNDAAKLLREAVKVDPYNPFLRRKLAAVYAEAESFDKAVRELKSVVGIEPNFHAARFMLASIYEDLGMEGKACEQYRILEAKKLEHLELKVQNEYEKRLIHFDWSSLPKM